MFTRPGISLKYTLVFLSTLILLTVAILAAVNQLKLGMLRNEAQAVATQVVSFRSWVAQTGMVWVDNLPDDFHDFLASSEGEDGKEFYGKNPALATRELSSIANQSSLRATFRVTSDQYRHPSNKPDGFESKAIAAFEKDKDTKYVEEVEGSSYRYAQPIYVKKACLKCHGKPEEAPEAVIKKYGDRKAFGYKIGDVRGIISVKLPDLSFHEFLPTLANPVTIAAVVIVVLINAFFTAKLLGRLRDLTRRAEKIAGGELNTQLDYVPPESSRDEIDHLYNAVDQLRGAIRVAVKRLRK
jgi:methyl-accepting chemotaxis protein